MRRGSYGGSNMKKLGTGIEDLRYCSLVEEQLSGPTGCSATITLLDHGQRQAVGRDPLLDEPISI